MSDALPATPTPDRLRPGLNMLVGEGVFAQLMVSVTSGAFLAAYALLLGATNLGIGLVAAVGPAAQFVQLPATWLVERSGRRRRIAVQAMFASRAFLLLAGLVPFLIGPDGPRIELFLLSLGGFSVTAAVAGCSISSWMRDLLPETVLGAFFARRLAWATAAGAVATLAAGVLVDQGASAGEKAIRLYGLLFVAGAVFGVVSGLLLSRVPEPERVPGEPTPFRTLLRQPFADANYREVLRFLGLWNVVVGLSTPFFAVYVLRRLDLSMALLVGLSVLSQVANVAFFRVWGRMADRFSNKSTLSVALPISLVSLVIWPFTTLPDYWAGTIPLLVLVHVLMGISNAGTLLCANNLALRVAPRGQATAYLAANAVVGGIAASAAPLLGGFAADLLGDYRLDVALRWTDTAAATADAATEFAPISFSGLDFLFFAAAVVGFLALSRLVFIREEGEVEDGVAAQEFYGIMRRGMQQASNVAGVRRLTSFPYAMLQRVSGRRARPARRED